MHAVHKRDSIHCFAVLRLNQFQVQGLIATGDGQSAIKNFPGLSVEIGDGGFQHLEALVEAKDKALEMVADKIGAAIERVVKPAVDGTAPTAPEPAGS